MTPTARTLALLRKAGYLVAGVEKWIPRANVRRDLFHVGDVLAVHPGRWEFLLVQATTLPNVATRVHKARAVPELAVWLRAGGLFEVWGFDGKRLKRVALTGQDLAAEVIVAPRRAVGLS